MGNAPTSEEERSELHQSTSSFTTHNLHREELLFKTLDNELLGEPKSQKEPQRNWSSNVTAGKHNEQTCSKAVQQRS